MLSEELMFMGSLWRSKEREEETTVSLGDWEYNTTDRNRRPGEKKRRLFRR